MTRELLIPNPINGPLFHRQKLAQYVAIVTDASRFIRNGISMPLARGQIVGHDNERLAFAFTMMNDGETVQCQISDAAMDDLAEAKGTPSIARQAQFVAHRDTIERIASDLFGKAPQIKGYVVRIFSKHIQGARRVS
jgi:hypothetical protein